MFVFEGRGGLLLTINGLRNGIRVELPFTVLKIFDGCPSRAVNGFNFSGSVFSSVIPAAADICNCSQLLTCERGMAAAIEVQ